MKTPWLLVALVAVLFGTALSQQFNFDTLTTITSSTVTSSSIEIINGIVEDTDFLYFFTLSPVVLSKVNKSELAIEGNSPDILSTRYQIAAGGTVSAGVAENGHIYLLDQDRIYKVPVDNFPGYTTLLFNTNINPVTSFTSEDSQGVRYLNFPTSSSFNAEFYQVRFDKFDLPVVNASRSFPLPEGAYQASAYNNNGTAFLATLSGDFYELEIENMALPLNFSVANISVSSLSVDWDRRTIYVCGDYIGTQVRDFIESNLIFLCQFFN